MDIREELIIAFLTENGWGTSTRTKLFSDASFRHYERLSNGEKSVMLMDAPPEKEDIKPFVNIDHYLRRNNFNAPQIYAMDEKNGFLLLEDFGNDSYTNLLSGKSSLSGKYEEEELYCAAIDVIAGLHRIPLAEKIADYDYSLLMRECRLLVDWYLPNIGLDMDVKAAGEEYIEIWKDILTGIKPAEPVTVMRDFHADNLMWIPNRSGIERVGLLDFQDAVAGSPVYDLVSLLEDARRDVANDTVDACLKRYIKNRKVLDKDEFMANYAMFAAQRNCKIVGIFARLAIRDNKPRYLSYMPRVWGHLMNDIKHPALAPLKKWISKIIPAAKRKPDAFIIPEKEESVA
jgi:aminoglycoside/choline kinase family phosphotransferase